MPTPVGHALAGVVVGQAATWRQPLLGPWKDLALFAALGVVADLDFLPGILAGKHDLYHHGLTHSLGAAVLVGLIAALWGWRKKRAWRWGLMGFAVYFSHVVLDAMGQDTSYPYGVPLWWPLSPKYVMADWAFFLDIRRVPFGWPVIRHNLVAIALELAVLGPPALFVTWWRLRRKRVS
jgi:inner membrane protein